MFLILVGSKNHHARQRENATAQPVLILVHDTKTFVWTEVTLLVFPLPGYLVSLELHGRGSKKKEDSGKGLSRKVVGIF